MLEALMILAPREAAPAPKRPGIDPALRRGRMCYDHLAGELGVTLTEALVRRGALLLGPDGCTLTPDGATFFERFQIEFEPANARRLLCRPCLDWSERRFHLADHVTATQAACENGLLHIDLAREVPEAQKPRAIPIQASANAIEATAAAPQSKQAA